MQRTTAAVVFSVVLAATLAGCGGSGKPATVDTTVLVYMIGTDLESVHGNATVNLEEMMVVGSTASMNVVVQTGGALLAGPDPADKNAMQPDNIDWTHVQRYVVNRGSLRQVGDLGEESFSELGPVVPDPQPAVNMGSATTLENFLRWGVQNYPARRYVLVLWDHGGGVNVGVGADEVTKWTIAAADIVTTVAQAAKESGKFEIVGFDACLMGTAEVASGLAAGANYLVASQDIEPGTGWDYELFLEYVTTHPESTITGRQIGTRIADSYVAKQLKADPDAAVTLSVTDLSKAEALSTATNAFATALGRYVTPGSGLAGWKQIAEARARSLDFYTSAMAGLTYDLVDLLAFSTRVVTNVNREIGADPALTSAGDAVVAALQAAVVYKVASGSNAGAAGLTVYFPSILAAYPDWLYSAATSDDTGQYFASAYTNGTNGLVKAYHDFYAANASALQATVTMTPTLADPLAASIGNDFHVAMAASRSASCNLFQRNRDGTETPVTVPCFRGMQPVPEAAPTQDGKWLVTFSYTAAWPHIADQPVALIPDQLAGFRPGDLNSFLVPVSRMEAEGYVDGFLEVEEILPPAPGPSTFRVLGFQARGLTPGKSERLVDGEVYALGAYVSGATGSYFGRSDREVTVSSSTLVIDTKVISGGQFGYVVTDLTGAVQVPGTFVPYAPAP